MKRISIILVFIISFSATLSATEDTPPSSFLGTIIGFVTDSWTGEPMPYVNVIIKNQNDSIVTGGITNDKGIFEVDKIPAGTNIVEIQFIGYKKVIKKIEITRKNRKNDLSTISLIEETQQLDEVVVRGEISTVVQKIDRRVINVGKDLTATGTTAAELLNNVQSVSVDPQSGAVSLRGNENVRIFIDGKPSNMSPKQLLEQIPSSSIKSVELITNPSAKYSPEGMSGIINIVLDKNIRLGLNGMVNGGLGYGKKLKYNGAMNINYRVDKLNIYANYGGNSGQRWNNHEQWREYNNTHSNFEKLGSRTSHMIKAGADYYLNEASTISFFTIQNAFNEQGVSKALISSDDVALSDNWNDNLSERGSSTYNLNFKRMLGEKGQEVEIEASHFRNNSAAEGMFEQRLDLSDPSTNYGESVNNFKFSNRVNLDYTNPLSDNIKLELGMEYRSNHTQNAKATDRHYFQYDDMNSKIPDADGGFLTVLIPNSSFDYMQSIYSGYANYGQKMGKLTMQIGVRVEQYDVKASFNQGDGDENYTSNKFTAYPSAFLTYRLQEKNQFQLSYSRRVDRPGIDQVNPIRSEDNPLVIFLGNPELRPQFTNSYEFNYSRQLGKGSFSFGAFFRQITDNIIRNTDFDPQDEQKLVLVFVNAEGENRYGFEASAMYRPLKKWNINASADLYSRTITGYAFGEAMEISSIAKNIKINNVFTLTDNLTIQLAGFYRGERPMIQWTIKPSYAFNAGVSLKVLDKKGSINLRMNDIFNTNRFSYESSNFLPIYGYFGWESRTAFLSFSYRFGSSDFKELKRRNRENYEFSGGGM